MDFYAQLIKAEYITAFGLVNVTSFQNVLKLNDMCHASRGCGGTNESTTTSARLIVFHQRRFALFVRFLFSVFG